MPRRVHELAVVVACARYWPPCHERQQKSRARACIGRRYNTSVAGGPSLWRHLVGLANWSSSHRPCETSNKTRWTADDRGFFVIRRREIAGTGVDLGAGLVEVDHNEFVVNVDTLAAGPLRFERLGSVLGQEGEVDQADLSISG